MKKAKLKPFLMGRKLGMTRCFSDTGESIGVTVVRVGPCSITEVKTLDRHGYDALQVGFEPIEFAKVNRPTRGLYEKRGLKPFNVLKEFWVEPGHEFELGQELSINLFSQGQSVDITGVSKGKGFQGVIKRHHKGGGPASHGSHFHRSTGSIGQRTWPGRVFKLMKLPGHMGSEQVTVRNLEIVKVDPERNYLFIRGSIPGPKQGLVVVKAKNTTGLIQKSIDDKEVEENKENVV